MKKIVSAALTFARTEVGDDIRLYAIIDYRADQLTGVDITEAFDQRYDDPVELFDAQGYESILEHIESASSESRQQINVSDLTLPLALTDAHVAAGTNFAAHADESSVEDGPFLFAKMVKPTPFDAEVSAGEGFADGKSKPGFLPVGNLFVIPRELRDFLKSVELNLAVNGKLRQCANLDLAIWDIDELFRQIEKRQAIRWQYQGAEIGLPIDDNQLPPRTMILSGTPAGTIFSGISAQTMAWGALRWVCGGWNQSLKRNVIESYLETSIEQQNYLSAGDLVEIQVDQLGRIATPIQ